MGKNYEYNPLPPTGWIRILVVEPASQPTEPLEMRLETCQVTSNLNYEALSYTWGNEAASSPISIQGRKMLIRKNLLGALQTLRRSDALLALWVDAICINQDDIMERNHQVWQMKDIFSKARLVNVWLGDADDGSDSGMDFIGSFGEALTRSHPTHRIRVGSTWNAEATGKGLVASSTLSEEEFYDYYGHRILSLSAGGGNNAPVQNAIQLLRRPWWKRMWTLQESVLGRHVTVHCGTKRITMSYFFEFSYFLFLAMAYERRFSFEELPKDIALRAVFRIADLRDHIHGRGHVPTLLAMDSSWHRAAYDDKDKIMALLGLVSWQSNLRPEYGWDVSRIYQTAINTIIIEENNLGFLGLISEENILRRANLPSWVPDLRLHTQYHSDYLTSLSKAIWHYSVYDASLLSNAKRAEIRTEEDESLLIVRGILFDRISVLGIKAPNHTAAIPVIRGAIPHTEAWRIAMLTQWAFSLVTVFERREGDVSARNIRASFRPVYSIPNRPILGAGDETRGSSLSANTIGDEIFRLLFNIGKYAATGEDYLTAFWRCVFVDLKQGTHHGYDPGKPQRLDQEDITSLSEEWFGESEDATEHLFEWWSSFAGPQTSYLRLIEQFNRKFFITETGYIGLGPPWLQENDAVCILSGGTVAYALRELGGDEWSYVGEW